MVESVKERVMPRGRAAKKRQATVLANNKRQRKGKDTPEGTVTNREGGTLDNSMHVGSTPTPMERSLTMSDLPTIIAEVVKSLKEMQNDSRGSVEESPPGSLIVVLKASNDY